MARIVPQEFCRLALQMHQDIDIVLEPDEDVVEHLVQSVSSMDHAVIVEFIDELLRDKVDAEELSQLFADAGADFFIAKGNHPVPHRHSRSYP